MIPELAQYAAGHFARSAPATAPDAGTGVAAGTVVLTAQGEMPIESIAAGTRIVTRDAGIVRLSGLDRIDERCTAIRFAAGSLGDTRPETDLILPARQQVLIRDWRAKALFGATRAIPDAEMLVDGEFICDLGPRDMTLYRMRFDRPHIVYAGGLELAIEPLDITARRRVA